MRAKGTSRRTFTKILPWTAGALGLAALGGLGAWSLSHRPKSESEPEERQSTETPRSFSVSALSGDFARGVVEAWSTGLINDTAFISVKGDRVFVISGDEIEPSPQQKIAIHHLYSLTESGLGDPIEVKSSNWTDEERHSSSSSADRTWWGDSPILRDKIIDPRSGDVSPVPWDTSTYKYLGGVDNDTALLQKSSPTSQHSGAGEPITAIDRQGKELWSTPDSYLDAFFDPAQPDILIGYQKDTSDDFASVPHLLSTTTGETVAALPSSNALFLATDGVVIATGLSSGPTSATASAFSFSGEQQWEQQVGECEKIAFDGVPSLDVIQRSLTELAGMTVIVAENGAALVSNESGGTFSLRNEDGTSGPSLRVGDRFTLLADGSGVLTVPSRENRDSDLSPEDMLFIDAASGNVEKYFSELEFPFSHHEPQSVQNLFYASTVHELAKGSPNRLLAKTREGVTCYVPAT